MDTLRAIWLYRGFVIGCVKREFQSKYRNSLLGASWNVLNPLAMIVVYTVIFTEVMRSKLPGVDSSFSYSIYLCAGVLTWNLFAEEVSRSISMFVDNANLLKKISFPRIAIPLVVTSNASLNFVIVATLFCTFLLLSNNFPGWVVLGVIPILLLQTALASGLGLVLGVFNVFFRDVGQFFGIFIQFWFWLTPIVYPAEVLPDSLKSWLAWNPMLPIVSGYQRIFVAQEWPAWGSLIYPLLLAIGLCILGLRLFRQHAAEMVDEL
jgi:lipopolysaccharide transport system permease protein